MKMEAVTIYKDGVKELGKYVDDGNYTAFNSLALPQVEPLDDNHH